ncbi:GTPase HflX [Candidatus Bathyarchaeota archaeon]|nr:MAG: GTPase HflX [Candidatus Bathyarchaeota archaeon]
MRAIIVERRSPNERSHLEELRSLAEAAGYKVVGRLEQVREPDPKYQIGPGKAKELAELVSKLRANVVIFDNELKPVQAYNLAKLTGVEVIDRFQLILQIFALRASTKEAKLQIQLARLQYELARAKEKVRLAKMGEQPGFLGLGRYEVDDYYELIRRQIAYIKKKLRKVSSYRKLHRRRRRALGYPLVSLSGYTNAGKSTIFYALTQEFVPISPSLFTTLTTKTRIADFNGRKALLTDTVGFIDRLPVLLVEAFKSTLEETVYSDVILLVVDISEPIGEVVRKLGCCLDVLREIGAEKIPTVVALNKIDLLDQYTLEERVKQVRRIAKASVPVSALYELNLEELKAEIAKRLPGYVQAKLFLPWNSETPAILSMIHERSHVISVKYEGDGVEMELEATKPFVGQLTGWVKRLGGEIRTNEQKTDI